MKSAVLFLIFKRADTTKRVYDAIRQARPPRLYIAADGPRAGKPGELEACEATRKMVEAIDWPCTVHRLYRDENAGCGKGVSAAISWFFQQEEEGIILEDDILPNADFFLYCDELLERYRQDYTIHSISGHSSLFGASYGKNQYYLSEVLDIWGWASWKRVWRTYEYDIHKIPKWQLFAQMLRKYPLSTACYYLWIYLKMQLRPIDTWDYQFLFNMVLHNQNTIVPYTNLTQNIGFGDAATHTTSMMSPEATNVTREMGPLTHPPFVERDAEAVRICMVNKEIVGKALWHRACRVIRQRVC